MTIGISSGALWKKVKNYLMNNVRFGEYTYEMPTSSNYIEVKPGEYQEPRTGALFPFTDFEVYEENSIIFNQATVKFQIVLKLDGNNSYEQISNILAQAIDISNDILILTKLYYKSIDENIKEVEIKPQEPVGVKRVDNEHDVYWLVVISPTFNLKWISEYSADVITDNTINYNSVTAGIYIAKPRDFNTSVKDTDIVFSNNEIVD